MARPERTTYTPLDFIQFREANSLILVPKFQRRGVWRIPQRSYFIDTLVRNMPVPPIYLRATQSEDKKRMVREVVDGQQRISAVLDYIDGKYSLSKTLDAPYKGMSFDELKPKDQDAVRGYSFICEVLQGVSDSRTLCGASGSAAPTEVWSDRPAVVTGFHTFTNAVLLQAARSPCCRVRAGDIAAARADEEHVSTAELYAAVRIYLRLALRLCKVERGMASVGR